MAVVVTCSGVAVNVLLGVSLWEGRSTIIEEIIRKDLNVPRKYGLFCWSKLPQSA